jgi:hypothetical protein
MVSIYMTFVFTPFDFRKETIHELHSTREHRKRKSKA